MPPTSPGEPATRRGRSIGDSRGVHSNTQSGFPWPAASSGSRRRLAGSERIGGAGVDCGVMTAPSPSRRRSSGSDVEKIVPDLAWNANQRHRVPPARQFLRQVAGHALGCPVPRPADRESPRGRVARCEAAGPTAADSSMVSPNAARRETGLSARRASRHCGAPCMPQTLAARSWPQPRRALARQIEQRKSSSSPDAAGRIVLPAARLRNRSSAGTPADGGRPQTTDVGSNVDAVIDGRVARHSAIGVVRAAATVSPVRAEGHAIDARCAAAWI